MAAKKTTKKKDAKKPAKSSPTKSSATRKASVAKSAGTKSAKKPAVKKPAVKKPAVKKPAAKQSAAKQSAAKQSAAKKAAASAKKPAARKAATPKAGDGKKPAAKKAAAKKPAAKKPVKAVDTEPADNNPEGKSDDSPEDTSRSQAASDVADRVLSGAADKSIADLGADLISNKKSVAAQAARVLDEIVSRKPESVVPIIDKFATAIGASAKRPAQSAANALPQMSRVAPARVARHLPRLKESFDKATPAGKDGLIRTFAGLCTASVAYQKRLEDVLNKGLREADAKTLIAWTEVVLPALKGEPHARARATVEARLGRIPKVHAQKIADFLGIKLRLRYR